MLPVEERPRPELPKWLSSQIKDELQEPSGSRKHQPSPRLVKLLTASSTCKCSCSTPRIVSALSSPRTAELAARADVAAILGFTPPVQSRPSTARLADKTRRPLKSLRPTTATCSGREAEATLSSSPFDRLTRGLSSRMMDGASADGTPKSARSIRVKPHRVAAGTRTPWHSEWEAEKKDAKLQFKADFEQLVQDMHAALQQEARQLNEMTGERMAKEAFLTKLTKQFEDGKDMSTKLFNDKERLSSRLQELEHDLAIVTEELDEELRDELTREHMYNTLAAVRSCWERRRQDHASRVVEACEQLRDLKERHEVAAFMEQHVLRGLAQAKEALVRQRAKQEETKVAMKAKLVKMGGGKRRASSNMHGNCDVDTDKMSPAMAAAYAAALKAAGDLPADATDEQRAAASQAIADALSQEPGNALRATQNHSKKSMGIQDAWQRLCELSENEDPQIVFEYCMEQLDTHEQLAASRERRRDRIETMERKMKEYNVNFVAVRDFADARRQAFDEQARKVEAKYYAASIVCREKRRRYVHISSVLDTAENILQTVTSRVQHKLLMDKMPAGPRASAYKLSKNLDDAKRQLSEYLAELSKAEAATEASAANNVDPVPEGAPAQAKQSALKRTGTESEVLHGEGIEESLKAASSPEEKHAYFRIKLNEKLCNLVEFVTRMLQDMMRWDDEQRQQRQPYFAPQLEGRMARAYNLRISKEQLSATFRDHRFTKAPTMADEMAYALAAESPYADEASMFDNLDQLLYEDEPQARSQEKKSGKGGRSLFDQASTAMVRARRRSLRERERDVELDAGPIVDPTIWDGPDSPAEPSPRGLPQDHDGIKARALKLVAEHTQREAKLAAPGPVPQAREKVQVQQLQEVQEVTAVDVIKLRPETPPPAPKVDVKKQVSSTPDVESATVVPPAAPTTASGTRGILKTSHAGNTPRVKKSARFAEF